MASVPPANLTSRALTPAELSSLTDAIASYARNLDLDISAMGAAEIQTWIFNALIKLQRSQATRQERIDLAFWLAVAWGETLKHNLNWEWVMLEQAENSGAKSIGVACSDRSHAVAVLQFLERLATDGDADQTSLLLFNMIMAGDMPAAAPGELLLLG